MDYFGGKLYMLVDGEYVTVVHGLVTCALTVRMFPLSPAMSYRSTWRDRRAVEDYGTSYHLANLGGQLLVILSHSRAWYDPSDNSLLEFEVYKFVQKGDDNKNDHHWAEVTDLDGHAVFLGSHQSFCLPADPLLNNGVKGNRIYFVFQDLFFRALTSNEYGNDCGVFDLGDHKVERFYCHSDVDGGGNLISKRKARTFWFLPMPWASIHKHRNDQERTFEQTKTKPAAVDVPKLTKKTTNYKNNQQHGGNYKVNRLANRFQVLLTDEDEGQDKENDEDDDDVGDN
ncbi:unnamed protein product [Linum trigynum]|uniref:KIB1-4 beta-propeller domain-containing protein n=1 Tax=Linum trigynum TaxID=586398 RepID=A0AAV2GDB7_9ROSI